MFNKELLLMGAKQKEITKPEQLIVYSNCFIDNCWMFIASSSTSAQGYGGALGLEPARSPYRVRIFGREETITELDNEGILGGLSTNKPWMTSREYPYLLATLLVMGSRLSGGDSPITSYASFVRDLAENYFSGAFQINPLDDSLYFTPEAYGTDIIHEMTLSLGTIRSTSIIRGDFLEDLWYYSERIRKGEI